MIAHAHSYIVLAQIFIGKPVETFTVAIFGQIVLKGIIVFQIAVCNGFIQVVHAVFKKVS